MSVFVKIQIMKYRAQSKDELGAMYGDTAPSFTTVKFWVAEFKRVRTNLGGDVRNDQKLQPLMITSLKFTKCCQTTVELKCEI